MKKTSNLFTVIGTLFLIGYFLSAWNSKQEFAINTQPPAVEVGEEVVDSEDKENPLTESPVSVSDKIILTTTSPMLTLINEKRTTRGMVPLIEVNHLDAGAYSRAIFLIEHDQWSHEGYVDAIRGFMLDPKNSWVGENLARFYQTPEEVIEAWMASPIHRKLILADKYRYIGIGHYQSYWVLWFTNKP